MRNEVFSFLSTFYSVNPEKIFLDSDLQKDLNIDAEAVADVLRHFAQRYQVDMSCLVANASDDGLNSGVWKKIRGLAKGAKPIYVKDLVMAAELKVWLH